MSGRRFLVLGGGEGWHMNQLRSAAEATGCEIAVSPYETLAASIGRCGSTIATCSAGTLGQFDAILTRTMPAASLEQITFRLATLHSLTDVPLVNPPRALEIAIDKFATLAHVAALGYPVPETIVVQSRGEAMDAFERLGGDCVVKPIFGGEGRGVTRIADPQLAWYAFSTLEGLGAVCYLQEFVAPGGIDTRLLVIGERVIGLRRTNELDFRTNVASGALCQSIEPNDVIRELATAITRSIGLTFASVDLLDCADGSQCVLEVNAIPGWKGAQQVADTNIAAEIVHLLCEQADTFDAKHGKAGCR